MKVDRFPIILNDHSVMVIHMFTRTDYLEDLWMSDFMDTISQQSDSAKQFLSQLDDHWTPHFLIELRKAITERLQEHDDKYGTTFAQIKNEI